MIIILLVVQYQIIVNTSLSLINCMYIVHVIFVNIYIYIYIYHFYLCYLNSNFFFIFKKITRSLKNNLLKDTQSTVMDKCSNTEIESSSANNSTTTSEEGFFDDGDQKVGIFFAASIFVIPITIMLCTYKTKPDQQERILSYRNECISRMRQNSDVLPDYNDVVKDAQNLPSYEEIVTISPTYQQ